MFRQQVVVVSLSLYETEYLLESHEVTDIFNLSVARKHASGNVSNYAEAHRRTSHANPIYVKAKDQYIASDCTRPSAS
jgi:hypothetical protein